jgi:hypothetical protein
LRVGEPLAVALQARISGTVRLDGGIDRIGRACCAILRINQSHDLPHSLGQACRGVRTTLAGRLIFKQDKCSTFYEGEEKRSAKTTRSSRDWARSRDGYPAFKGDAGCGRRLGRRSG